MALLTSLLSAIASVGEELVCENAKGKCCHGCLNTACWTLTIITVPFMCFLLDLCKILKTSPVEMRVGAKLIIYLLLETILWESCKLIQNLTTQQKFCFYSTHVFKLWLALRG